MKFAILIIAAYLLGSIPYALILAKAHGKDLRSIGSGNVGATNLARALGFRWGCFCFALDATKGIVPTFIAALLLSSPPAVSELFLTIAVGCAAVVGHIFPIYTKFKGGKGVATSFGIAFGLWPYCTFCAIFAIAVFATVVLIWRYVSLGSIVGSIAFPLALIVAIILKPQWNFASLWPLFIIAIALPVMVTLRHISNIKRLRAGTESKIF